MGDGNAQCLDVVVEALLELIETDENIERIQPKSGPPWGLAHVAGALQANDRRHRNRCQVPTLDSFTWTSEHCMAHLL